jgi:rfaE bifunctional protein kinase chain/domain
MYKEASENRRVPIAGASSVEEMGRKLLKKLRCRILVITQGEKGMTIFEEHKRPRHIENAAREVFDVTGAGDTVIATLAACIAAGASLRTAAIIANHAAGIVVGKLGTATATREEIMKSLKQLSHVRLG